MKRLKFATIVAASLFMFLLFIASVASLTLNERVNAFFQVYAAANNNSTKLNKQQQQSLTFDDFNRFLNSLKQPNAAADAKSDIAGDSSCLNSYLDSVSNRTLNGLLYQNRILRSDSADYTKLVITADTFDYLKSDLSFIQERCFINKQSVTDADDHQEHNHDHEHDHDHDEHGDHDHQKNATESSGNKKNSKTLTLLSSHNTGPTKADKIDDYDTKKWIYSIISALIISVVGLLCIAIVPLMNTFRFNYLFQFLVALAVGTLSGDALIHLIPHAFHNHEESTGGGGDHHHHHNDGDHDAHNHHGTGSNSSTAAIGNITMTNSSHHSNEGAVKGLGAILGIFVFFVVERIMQIRRARKERRHRETELAVSENELENFSNRKIVSIDHTTPSDIVKVKYDDFVKENDGADAKLLKTDVLVVIGGGKAQQKAHVTNVSSTGIDDASSLLMHANKDLKYIQKYLPNNKCEESIDHHDHENEVEHLHQHRHSSHPNSAAAAAAAAAAATRHHNHNHKRAVVASNSAPNAMITPVCTTASSNNATANKGGLVKQLTSEFENLDETKTKLIDSSNTTTNTTTNSETTAAITVIKKSSCLCKAPSPNKEDYKPAADLSKEIAIAAEKADEYEKKRNNSNRSKEDEDDENRAKTKLEEEEEKGDDDELEQKHHNRLHHHHHSHNHHHHHHQSPTPHAHVHHHHHHHHGHANNIINEHSPTALALQHSPTAIHSHLHSHSHLHNYRSTREKAHHDHHKKHEKEISSVKLIAWMVIMGDGLHNFADGLAIGASFANSLAAGVGTSIAVLFHELPHEIGDFAVLRRAGVSLKRAFIFNALSGVLCLLGVVAGILIGELETFRGWCLLFTAGVFLYISLVDMIPELSEDKEDVSICNLLIQSSGFLVGVGIMFLVAVYEEKINGIFIN